MNNEVRYHMLRPKEIIERRKQMPVAYIPVGTIEWHGLHNPVGADGLQAEGIAVKCAQLGGGVVFPTLYYGENRLEALMEATGDDKELIAREMELPVENFSHERQPFSPTEQALNYHKLLLHILAEVESLGFEVGVFVPGHYPLIDHTRAAVLQFNKREYSRKKGLLAWAFVDYLLVRDLYKVAGDHAAGWETSHMMALHPQTVDLSVLPEKGEHIVGVGGKMAPQDATADFGWETIEAAARIAVAEVKHRVENKDIYRKNGCSLMEGLWRNQE